MAKTQIKNYIFKPGIGAADNLYPNAYSLLLSNKSFIQKEATAWIQDQIDAGTSGFVGYTYNATNFEIEIGNNIDAYLSDLRYGGNENTYNVVKYYWDKDVAQIDGDRQPEIQTYAFIKTLIQTYILINTAYSASNAEVSQIIDITKIAESGTSTILGNLIQATADVIETGISAFPTLVPTGVGNIKIQGRYDLDQLLLITNVSKNEIIYNFSALEQGGLVSLKTDNIEIDSDFVSYLQATDAVTKITLNYNTSNHTSTDELQIFVEKIENGKSVVTTRPYDFGTDAIERMRVAQPASMLDADFEYGLQPTKWAAIGTLRGYPSVYEIPGTDTPVISVVTDASVGTEGVGQSLITVTTVSPHGFEAGTPITIKALEDSVVGAARAEGSFVITTVPTNNTFTYFAKSKVGTADGDVLSTTYTQLRQAGFYTGANIGRPTVTIQSNGFSGTLVGELDIAAGSTIIPFDGPSPEVGAPLTNANMPSGTQVTAIIDTSAGGGEYITPALVQNVNLGDTSIEVADATGIVPNLATDRGDGTAIYVTSINGTTVNFSDEFTSEKISNTSTYTNVLPSVNIPIGSTASFNIATSSGVYSLVGIANSGDNYQTGDRILISGDNFKGFSPANDLIITVDLIDSAGGIDTVTLTGSAPAGNEVYNGIEGATQNGIGTDARFNVIYEDNVYTADIFSPDISLDYSVNDIIVIPGDLAVPNGGNSPANDVYITVDAIGAGGAIVSVTTSGTAPNAQNIFANPSYTTSNSGTGAEFTVYTDGANYTTIIATVEGVDFLPGDTVTILGTELGGTSPANDLAITIDNVGGTGNITDLSFSGIAFNGGSTFALPGTNRLGSAANFNVTLNSGSYDVILGTGGSGYGVGQTILISANVIVGSSPANDLTITITGVNDISTGVITTFTVSGTAYNGVGTFNNLVGNTLPVIGNGFTVDVLRTLGTYTSITTNNAGSNYSAGNSFTIAGSLLDGESSINDIGILVTSVDSGTGAITGFATSFESAAEGDVARLLSTIIVSEATTGIISTGDNITYGALATLEINFDTAHGLIPGNTFIVTVDSDNGLNGHEFTAGSFFATEVPTVNTLRYTARSAGTIDTAGGADPINAEVYPRPDSFFVHRPFDGGVQLGTGGPQHGSQAIRQSKKYIRYQSGKGIMYTTGALFAPSYDLRSVTADGVEVNSLMTVVTDDNDHGLQVGGIVRLLGIETPGYNSGPQTAVPPQFDYTVVGVIDERTFQIRSQRRLGSTTAVLGFGSQMSVVSWHGATVRSGIFDDQNGIFWEFDGTQISVVQRTGTQQLAGTIALQVDNNLVTGTNTRFRDQLKAGDRIIIKGMTHVVSHVNSQTEITVTPDWRGVVDITGAKANLVVDKKAKQSEFNLDRLDGTGPSGYEIDIAKMQMIGIQYSWYGAGFIDFMLRGADGNFVFAHRMRNSNVNTEAFMRSGNLPVRYEVSNEGPSGKLASAMTNSQTSMILEDTSFFPNSGVVYVDNEIISFSGNNKTTNILTGLIRAATFTNFQAGATRSYTAGSAATHDARTGVVLISQSITPLISHWGSAFITDGLFDEDRGYIFSYAETGIEVSTTRQTAFMIRLAPSVSNALVGDLGERELLNRAQLLLQGLEVTSDGISGTTAITGGIVVEGVLNPQNYPLNPDSVSWSTLSSQAQGGQPSFAQVASGGGIEWSTGAPPPPVAVNWQPNLILAGVTNQTEVDASGGNRTDNVFVLRTVVTEQGLRVGAICNTIPFNGRRITRIENNWSNGSTQLSRIFFNDRATNENTDYQAGTLNLSFTFNTERTNSPIAFFTESSWNTGGLGIGATVDPTDTNWPANTAVSNIQFLRFGTTNYYEVQFSSSSNTTLNGVAPDTVTFVVGDAAYAEPGETVFSFIAVPGERSTLDLSELKELTNTPLGGRGTYPNGPDVLAINVYKVSGAAVPANIILRWGEAQA